MFEVTAIDTNYSEIPTGIIDDASFEQFICDNGLEIVSLDASGAVVEAEWGNGEGVDTFNVRFIS